MPPLLLVGHSGIINKLKLGIVVGVLKSNDGIAVTTKENSEFLHYCTY